MSPRRVYGRLRVALKRLQRLASGRGPYTVDAGVTVRELGEPGQHVFFGYYDVTPFGPGDRHLLALRRPAGSGTASAGTPLQLGSFDLGEPEPRFRQFATTLAWCWQQGCRLQWWRGGQERRVIYNISQAGRHRAVLQDIDSGEIAATLDRPIYSVTHDGARAASLNFARLQELRPGYGYGDLKDPWRGDACPDEDGIWLMDLQAGTSRLLLSLREIASRLPEESMSGAMHYFNHLLWSPGGTRLFFLHLWLMPNGKRANRAFIWDAASGELIFLGARQHFSHHWWVDEDRLLAYSTHEETGQNYHLYDLVSGERGVINPTVLTQDGHASISPVNSRLMLTDTYPNRSFEQTLMLYHMDTGRVVPIGDFYSPPAFRGEVRCDLHPRWSRGGTLVCVDSAHRGRRQLCIVDVEDLLRANGFLPRPGALQ